ncbi:adenosylmethionine--8-amino-7-oxononanoate transaminase [Dokdonella sp.]|uniref:adenosylmethionine--8-amino-7-oxononanoate transaminase n=1 Tax=Dokdonella sp. TaxID=2291710 RepID=UPI002F3E2ACE
MTLYASELAARDLAVVWHPCTQMHDHETLPMLPIARAEGAWLYGHDGRRWLDAVSSWWTCLLGHRHPRIVAALKDQLDRIDHVMLAGFTHEPAIQLAEELVRIAPRGGSERAGASRLSPLPHNAASARAASAATGAPLAVGAASAAIDVAPTLTRVFYADNGSSAIEVALKLSFHYWRNVGRGERTRFVALTGGYHGETLGALSVTDVALYRQTYAPLLLEPIFAPSPDAYDAAPGESAAACAQRRLGELRAILERHAPECCAVIVEPLVQCAGGMRMHDASYLTGLRALCDEFDLHLIADEIAVGFGRTGTLFACEQGGIVPDFLCLSKGLTGGTLPLSAVLTTTRVYDAFYAEYSAGKAFLHSHSYTGNPIACRAALATLAVLRDEPVLERNRALAAHLDTRLTPLADHSHVADVRRTGMIAAIELVKDKRTREPFPAAERRGLRVYRHGLAHEMLLRPLGNVVYFMPPYCITPEEIDRMVAVAAEGIEVALR